MSDWIQNDPAIPAESKRAFLSRFVRLYTAWNQPDKAAEWQQKLESFDAKDPQPDVDPKPESPNH